MDGGAENSPAIKAINKSVVHRICAGQVILDLSSAVKELVENSLDAGATSVEIALKEYGLESFQVIDNGSGISPKNFKVIVLNTCCDDLLDFFFFFRVWIEDLVEDCDMKSKSIEVGFWLQILIILV